MFLHDLNRQRAGNVGTGQRGQGKRRSCCFEVLGVKGETGGGAGGCCGVAWQLHLGHLLSPESRDTQRGELQAAGEGW